MTTCYFVSHVNRTIDYDYQKEIDEIKELNPDLIFGICISEFDPALIFRKFTKELSPWLVENNKKCVIFCSGPDGLEVEPNVLLEKTLGYYALNIHIAQGIMYTEGLIPQHYYKNATNWFTCYNNSPKYERGLLVDQLAKNNLLKDGIVTFQYPERVHSDPVKGSFNWVYHDGSILLDEEDFILHGRAEYSPNCFPKSYFKGFIDVVTESSFYPDVFFVTEKTMKPIVGLKPFIVLSSVDYHKNLVDEYGLELYDELFDYSFDSMVDVNDRIQGITDNLNRIVNMKFVDIEKIYNSLLPKIMNNRQKFLEYRNKKEKIIPKSLNFMTHTSDYQLYGRGYETLLTAMSEWLAK
jgi:hypothetical protein